MPTLTIGDRKVKVDDSFLKLSPDEQNATVEEIAKTLGGGLPAGEPSASAAPAEQPLPPPAPKSGEPQPSTLQGIREAIHAPTRILENGLFLNLGDRIRAGMGAIIGAGSYGDLLKKEQGETERYEKEHPIASTAANLIGGVMAPMASIGAASKGADLVTKSLLAAGAGGVMGAVQGGFGSKDWTDVAQTAKDAGVGGAVGGTIGLAIPGVSRAIGAGVSHIADVIRSRTPSVSRGASRHLIDAVEADGPAMIRSRLDELGPDAMLADAGESLKGKAMGASLTTDEARSVIQNELRSRDMGTNARIQDDINRVLGPAEDPQTVTNAIRTRRSNVDNVAYPNALDVAPAVRTGHLMQELEGYIPYSVGLENRALTNLRDMMTRYERRARIDPTTGRQQLDGNGNMLWDQIPVNQTDARVLHKVKNELDNVIEHDAPGLGVPAAALQHQQYALKQFRHALNETLEQQVPGYRAANRHSAMLARRADAVEAGTSYLGEGKTTASPSRFLDEWEQRELGERVAFAKGSRGEIDRKIGTKANDLVALQRELQGEGGWNADKIRTVHGDDAGNELLASVNRNARFRETFNDVIRNSMTAQRTAAKDAMKPTIFKEGDIVAPGHGTAGMTLSLLKAGGAKGLNSITGENQARVAGEVARVLMSRGSDRDRHLQELVEAMNRRGSARVTSQRAGDGVALLAATLANSQLDAQRRRSTAAR